MQVIRHSTQWVHKSQRSRLVIWFRVWSRAPYRSTITHSCLKILIVQCKFGLDRVPFLFLCLHSFIVRPAPSFTHTDWRKRLQGSCLTRLASVGIHNSTKHEPDDRVNRNSKSIISPAIVSASKLSYHARIWAMSYLGQFYTLFVCVLIQWMNACVLSAAEAVSTSVVSVGQQQRHSHGARHRKLKQIYSGNMPMRTPRNASIGGSSAGRRDRDSDTLSEPSESLNLSGILSTIAMSHLNLLDSFVLELELLVTNALDYLFDFDLDLDGKLLEYAFWFSLLCFIVYLHNKIRFIRFGSPVPSASVPASVSRRRSRDLQTQDSLTTATAELLPSASASSKRDKEKDKDTKVKESTPDNQLRRAIGSESIVCDGCEASCALPDLSVLLSPGSDADPQNNNTLKMGSHESKLVADNSGGNNWQLRQNAQECPQKPSMFIRLFWYIFGAGKVRPRNEQPDIEPDVSGSLAGWTEIDLNAELNQVSSAESHEEVS